MAAPDFRSLFPAAKPKPVIGVIHLPPLPGYETSPGLEFILAKALGDLAAIESGPLAGILVENENDRPHRVEAGRETIAVMTRVTRELVSRAGNSLVGIEILLNDPEASLAVAHAAGASFIRTDYFVDPMEREEYGGRMRIDPETLLRYRDRIGANGVLIFADIQVKYARLLVERTLTESARLARESGADAIVVTGRITGDPPRVEEIEAAKAGAGEIPVLVGSGLDDSNASKILAIADGAIVGTSLKTGDNVDPDKVRALVETIES
jgi:membrane complex biogenesis BtpA family protein